MGDDRDLDAEQRRVHGGAEAVPVAVVVGMGDDRDAGGEQLGAGRLDGDVVEHEPVVGARQLPVLDLGLGDRGAEVDVPVGRRLGQVGDAVAELAEEHTL